MEAAVSSGDVAPIERFQRHHDPVVQEIVQDAFTDYTQEQERLTRESPATLNTTLTFADTDALSPDNRLDAGDAGTLTATVRNDGQGIGFDVILKITSSNPAVALDATKRIGDINSGEEKRVTVPITTRLDAANGWTTLTVETVEKRGYNAQTQGLKAEVVGLREPKLAITSVQFEDGNNGIPEVGETVEMVVFIENRGVGEAFGVTAELTELSPGLAVTQRTIEIERIAPQTSARGRLRFSIPRTHTGTTLDYSIRVNDTRFVTPSPYNGLVAEKSGTMPIGALQPSLAFEVIPPDVLHNGATGQFTLIPKNVGTLTAENVNLSVTTAGASLRPTSIGVGELPPKADFTQSFSLTLPRGYTEPSVDIEMTLTQDDFPDLSESRSFAVDVLKPDLQVAGRFTDTNGNGRVETGETVVLTLDFTNRGTMNAEGVAVAVSTPSAGIDLLESPQPLGEIVIGGTRAVTAKFLIRRSVQIPAGSNSIPFPIRIEVTQTDFESLTETLDYQIYHEDTAIEVVTGIDEPTSPQPLPLPGITPPRLSFANATDRQVLTASEFRLNASVVAEGGLDYTQVKLNNAVVYDSRRDSSTDRQIGADRTNPLTVTQRLLLRNGENRVTLWAVDRANRINEQTITLIYRRPEQTYAELAPIADVDVDIPKSETRNPHAVALVIGIEKYQNVSDALYADRDALAFEGYFINLLGGDAKNVVRLINERATGVGIDIGLAKLKNLVTPGQSDVYVFYSGHGAPTTDGKQRFLIPHDGHPNFLKKSGYPMLNFYQELDKLNAKSVTVFVDACFSGTDKDNNLLSPDTKPVARILEGDAAFENLEILSSSTGTQISSSFGDKQHGLFTYYLLKGLRGEADTDRDGKIAFAELADYTRTQVSASARRMNREQEPMLGFFAQRLEKGE